MLGWNKKIKELCTGKTEDAETPIGTVEVIYAK
jgi:hypothetical protein